MPPTFSALTVLCLIVGTMAQSCPFPPIQDPFHTTPVLSDAFLQKIVDTVNAVANAKAIGFAGGFTVTFVYNGATAYTGGFGYADLPNGSPPDPATSIFRIGSLSKVFTTAHALLARDANLLNFDMPLSYYLGSFGNLDQTKLRSILGHMSGLPREAPCLENDCDIPTNEILQLLRNMSRVFYPYTRPAYSNLAFALLGHAVAQAVTDDPDGYELSIQEMVFDALNMSSSGFFYTEEVFLRLANGTANANSTFDHLGWANPCGGAYSTIADLASFLQVLTRDPNTQSFMEADTLHEWLNTPAFVFPSADGGYGYGFELEYDTPAEAWRVGKSGGISFWSGQILILSEYRVGIAVLASDASLSASDIADAVGDAIFPALTQEYRRILARPSIPPIQPELYVGVYSGYSIETGGTVSLAISKNSSTGSLLGTVSFLENVFPIQLSWIGKETFTMNFPDTLPLPCLKLTEISWSNELLTFFLDDSAPYLFFQNMLVECKFYKQ